MNYITSIFITGSIITMLSACSSGGGDSAPATPIGDITGSWLVTSTADATACGEGTYVMDYTLDVTSQSGSEISYTSKGNKKGKNFSNNFTGTLSGNKLTSSGSYPEDGGTTTGSTTLTIGSTCSYFSGTGTWSWTDGTSSCSGTSKLSGIRNNSTGCGNINASYDNDSINVANIVANIVKAGVPMKGTIVTSTSPKDTDTYKFTVLVEAPYKFLIAYDKTSDTLDIGFFNSSGKPLNNSTLGFRTSPLFVGEVFYIQIKPVTTTSANIPYTLTADIYTP